MKSKTIQLPYVVYSLVEQNKVIEDFRVLFSDKPIEKEDDLKELYSMKFPNIMNHVGSVCFGEYNLSYLLNKKCINELIYHFWCTPFESEVEASEDSKFYAYYNSVFSLRESFRYADDEDEYWE